MAQHLSCNMMWFHHARCHTSEGQTLVSGAATFLRICRKIAQHLRLLRVLLLTQTLRCTGAPAKLWQADMHLMHETNMRDPVNRGGSAPGSGANANCMLHSTAP